MRSEIASLFGLLLAQNWGKKCWKSILTVKSFYFKFQSVSGRIRFLSRWGRLYMTFLRILLVWVKLPNKAMDSPVRLFSLPPWHVRRQSPSCAVSGIFPAHISLGTATGSESWPQLTVCRPQNAAFLWMRRRKRTCRPQNGPDLWTVTSFAWWFMAIGQ